jgi:hypothetical protein
MSERDKGNKMNKTTEKLLKRFFWADKPQWVRAQGVREIDQLRKLVENGQAEIHPRDSLSPLRRPDASYRITDASLAEKVELN